MGDLYYVEHAHHIDETITADITLNPSHAIFKGHYPDQPVLPGACIVQLIKDVLASSLKTDSVLVKAVQMKFLQMIVPQENQRIALKIVYAAVDNYLKVTATLSIAEAPSFKFQGSFKTTNTNNQ
ncbi:ApeI family dehydratase [Mucilaginibacter ginkgonis]|uniref:ApeI dehydratase-like domain-containing protein n=1 Tax=Mucilaginibacter ginkgonis TaxID=2682091 RepID=A0A7T7JGC4_9SPHI|nr:hypothetical protein [Mucilaginibacter ginkgonis]QQL49390.1 hypothetical protein GO620_014630 [Mucilaginibacter ginkgonis]